VYHGPGILMSQLTGLYESVMYIAHTPVDDGTVHAWHALLVRAPSGSAPPTEADVEAARGYQQGALWSFTQDFGIWSNKRPCFHAMHVSGDGPFKKARLWYKQFYNPRARKQEFLSQAQGISVVNGLPGAPSVTDGMTLAEAVAAADIA